MRSPVRAFWVVVAISGLFTFSASASASPQGVPDVGDESEELQTFQAESTGTPQPALVIEGEGTAGWVPEELQAAYKIPDYGGAGHTVAVIVAGDNPNAEKDLAEYRSTYGLP